MPNPGPGGWGVVHVQDGHILSEKCGHSPDTTNNRMELTALIEAFKLIPPDLEVTIHSDSNLCVQTINEWAAGWEKKGWKRKTGPIANLELVQELWALSKTRPKAKLAWIKAHNGWLWNEYADALASRWAVK
ncbi:MAG: ribonuclease HI [Oligoflexia bacterium]|nr:ribonuclease HI [Oligoflexia bacterium]